MPACENYSRQDLIWSSVGDQLKKGDIRLDHAERPFFSLGVRIRTGCGFPGSGSEGGDNHRDPGRIRDRQDHRTSDRTQSGHEPGEREIHD
jgi:hypothetical protein